VVADATAVTAEGDVVADAEPAGPSSSWADDDDEDADVDGGEDGEDGGGEDEAPPRVTSWADESDDEFAPEVDIWAGPHVSAATYEELEERLEQVRGENGGDDEDSDSSSSSESEPEAEEDVGLVAPVIEKVEPPAPQLSKKELKRLEDEKFEAELAAMMGSAAPAPAKEEAKAPATADDATADDAGQEGAALTAAQKKKRKKANQKKKNKKKGGGGGEGGDDAKPVDAPKPTDADAVEAAKKKLAAKMKKGSAAASAKKKKETAARKLAEKKRKEAATKKDHFERARVGLPKISGDNAVGGDGRGG